MKTLATTMLALLAMALVAGDASAEENATAAEDPPELKPQTTCPVMGGPITKENFADHDGKRVYFCCAGCSKEFAKDPAKYIKKLEDDGVTLEKAPVAQTTCPVMGGPINKKYFADHDGKRVYFCCPACSKEFAEDPEKYVKKLEDEGFTLDSTPIPQAMCPVMNRRINKSIFADHDGKRVYFCCKGCVSAFKRDPGKYVKELEEKGISLEKAPAPAD